MASIYCHIRYELNLSQIEAFREYGRVWIALIEKHGGTHLGYFLPGETVQQKRVSFPGIGQDAPDNIAIALFSFPDWPTYDAYRSGVADEPECVRATELVARTKCFTRYERSFLTGLADHVRD
jgi:hypothetical protein